MFNQHRILRVFKLITLLKTYPAKTIRRLSQSLEVSERSTYRYLDLLAELGFEVTKDMHNKFSLGGDQIVDPFTKEEAQLIHEVLSVSVKNNPLVASIKAKLPSMEVSNILSNNIVSGHLAKLVAQINESIASQHQLRLLKYQSASSESITDRLVEPIGFTSNYQYLCAFEVESKQNKYFKIERMGSIEVLADSFQFTSMHKLLNPDVFGFNEGEESFPIQLRLSMRAQLWLRDDYPDTVKYLTEQADGSWRLDVTVHSMDPVHRIIRSMPGEVTLV
ncbi:WYL domain-containing protein [Aquirufa sp. OSTEICH-129V]|jgi:proteasome accessory factor C|uniref:WYL domain-containing protein n=1 Tax=Aquirufa avitistagni TaxID=3104728 RepID=A0ABW6DB88_9BACT